MNGDGFRFRSPSEKATFRFGETLGAELAPGVTILLSGELGTGKTVLVRGVGAALGVTNVRSPSFTLVNEYPAGAFLFVHADLYRLEPEAVDGLGLDDYLRDREGCALFVEWPERWRTPPADDVLKIAFEAPDENTRLLELSAMGGKAGLLLRKLSGNPSKLWTS